MRKIIKIIDPDRDYKKIKHGADIIRRGGIIVFPTETVYGIGCDINNEQSIKKIYEIKQRPINIPFTVHISDIKDIYILAREVPEIAKKYIEKYWPGPLTIVLKKNKNIPAFITSDLDTVGIRMPDHKVALSLIKETGVFIVGTSANISSKKNPQTVEDVIKGIDCEKIDLIIDSGKTKFGIPSTVVDLTEKQIKILRQGVLKRIVNSK